MFAASCFVGFFGHATKRSGCLPGCIFTRSSNNCFDHLEHLALPNWAACFMKGFVCLQTADSDVSWPYGPEISHRWCGNLGKFAVLINKSQQLSAALSTASLRGSVRSRVDVHSRRPQRSISAARTVTTQTHRHYCCFEMKPKVYVTRNDYARIGLDLLREECDISLWDEAYPVPRDEFLKNVAGKDAIYCSLNDRIDKELLDQAGPNLKVISTISVGYDHIDVKECKQRGIRIGYTPDVLTDATAELTVALLLATARRLLEANKQVHTGGWKSWSPMWMCGKGVKDSLVGIFGFGRIGQEVAKRLAPFKPARIQFTSRTDKFLTAEDLGVTQVPFDELIETSDFLIIACSYNVETANLFNDAVFSRMKPSAILINTSRGGVVEQHDLIHALRAGKIQAAGLDVTTPEPLPLDNPLLTLPNVVVLPHIGSADIETRIEMSRITGCNILAGLKGVKMISEV